MCLNILWLVYIWSCVINSGIKNVIKILNINHTIKWKAQSFQKCSSELLEFQVMLKWIQKPAMHQIQMAHYAKLMISIMWISLKVNYLFRCCNRNIGLIFSDHLSSKDIIENVCDFIFGDFVDVSWLCLQISNSVPRSSWRLWITIYTKIWSSW